MDVVEANVQLRVDPLVRKHSQEYIPLVDIFDLLRGEVSLHKVERLLLEDVHLVLTDPPVFIAVVPDPLQHIQDTNPLPRKRRAFIGEGGVLRRHKFKVERVEGVVLVGDSVEYIIYLVVSEGC